MGHKVVVFDISVIRALWETRVKKHKAWQKKEAERLEKSALEKYVFFVLACSFFSEWGLGRLRSWCGGGCSSFGISQWLLLIGLQRHPTVAQSECLIPITVTPPPMVYGPTCIPGTVPGPGEMPWYSKLSTVHSVEGCSAGLTRPSDAFHTWADHALGHLKGTRCPAFPPSPVKLNAG